MSMRTISAARNCANAMKPTTAANSAINAVAPTARTATYDRNEYDDGGCAPAARYALRRTLTMHTAAHKMIPPYSTALSMLAAIAGLLTFRSEEATLATSPTTPAATSSDTLAARAR